MFNLTTFPSSSFALYTGPLWDFETNGNSLEVRCILTRDGSRRIVVNLFRVRVR